MRRATAALVVALFATDAAAETIVGRSWVDVIGNLHVLVTAVNRGEAVTQLKIECSARLRNGTLVGLGSHTIADIPIASGESRPAEVIVELGGTPFDAVTCTSIGWHP